MDQVEAKSIKRDIPFALRRGTIGHADHPCDGPAQASETGAARTALAERSVEGGGEARGANSRAAREAEVR